MASRQDSTSRAGRPRTSATRALIYTLIVLIFIFVQLPMLWMVVTAFRVKGTAFRLDMIPNVRVHTPPSEFDPFALPRVGEGERVLHFEYADAEAASVEVQWRGAEAGEARSADLQRALGGNWFADVAVDPALFTFTATFDYRFSINGGEPIPDPRLPELTTAEGDWTRVVVEGTTFGWGGDLGRDGDRFKVYVSEAGGVARVMADPGSSLSILLGDTRRIDLPETAAGVYEATFDPGVEATYRIVRRRGWSEAFAEMYTLDNFKAILLSEDFNFGRYFMNSLVVATLAGFLTVFLCTLGGYAFAVKQFHFREPIFRILLASMLIPGMIFMVPQFSIVLKLGWMNSYQGMIVPHLANVFGLFLMRQYISQIPRDLFNAAEIDGANELQLFRNVVIPVCLPIMATLFLLTFVSQWSNFLWQLIVNTGDSPLVTLPVGLQQFKGQNSNDWEKIMAGACFSILPITVLFVTLQKYFIQGLTAGAVKE